jgi:V/A-type H+-transporting ATPase subunit G/H
MKTEVLRSIKKAEEDYRTMIREVKAERERRVTEAGLRSDQLVMKAKVDLEERRKNRLAEAREEAKRRSAAAVGEGEKQAAEMRQKGRQNLEKAVKFLSSRFEEELHAQG